jgi:hypothetical protein
MVIANNPSNLAGFNNMAKPYDKNNLGLDNLAGTGKKMNYEECKSQYFNPEPITNARLAHAYVPFQHLMCLYPPEVGLKQGTIFPELDMPYGTEAEYTLDA